MLRYLFFDVDDTLLDFSWAENQALHRTYAALGLPLTDAMYARYHAINRACWEEYERGELTREALLRARHERMFREFGLAADPEVCEALYRKNLAIGHCLVPHAIETLDALAPRYRLFAASNGVADTQYARLESAGLTKYFEKIFLSEELGACKPSPAYFEACFRQIPGFRREEALLIGDSPTSDIRGGRAAGLQTVLLNRDGRPVPPDLAPGREIRDLRELLDFL